VYKRKILYTITTGEDESGTVTITATADETSTKSIDLNIGAQPDLF
jgi:hypothetical protein